jgi:hypothetical protein
MPIAIIPMRSEPSERSEQVNQVLFGETFSILESNENWLYIETHFDSYKGWITAKMATILNTKEITPNVYLKEALGRISFPGNVPQYQWIPGGASLNEDNSEFSIYNESFIFDRFARFILLNRKFPLPKLL